MENSKCIIKGCNNLGESRGPGKKRRELCCSHRRPGRKGNPKERRRRKLRNKLIIDLECSMCGFVAEHMCQLDVDHKDGDKNNSSLNNLQVLCANCHRLKTYKAKDWTI